MKSYRILHKQYTLNGGNYQLKLPLELDILIPENDCVRLLSQLVEEMELTALYETYDRMPSKKYATPAMMLKIMLYAYHEGICSTRDIEARCTRDINFRYLLEGRQAPDHSAIARFRSKHLSLCSDAVMSELNSILLRLGQIRDNEVFIDGTKIEANANKYTFVWKKSVTKNMAKLLQKTALLVGDIIERNQMKPLWNHEVRKKNVEKLLRRLRKKAAAESIEFVYGRGCRKPQIQRDIESLVMSLDKISEYEQKLKKCGNRNSYSKTDTSATFMHMKDDHMMNGQLKPAYNVQHAVTSGYIVGTAVFPNPTDTLTFKPFCEYLENDMKLKFKRIVADAGYESEENLSYLHDNGKEFYIKPADYEQRKKRSFSKKIGRKENMRYDADEDCYICHRECRLQKKEEKIRRTGSGYERKVTIYHCTECDGCPYRCECMPGRNWKKPVEERYKKIEVSKDFEKLREISYENLGTQTGKQLMMNRSIQVEGSFADIKWNSEFTRFLCRGTEKVHAECTLFAMAHNIGWLHTRIQNDKLDLHLYDLKDEEEAV